MGARKRHARVICNKQASDKFSSLREIHTLEALTKMTGLSKNTLYKRIKTGVWTIPERALIERL